VAPASSGEEPALQPGPQVQDRAADGVFERASEGKIRGDGGRECASGAVGRARADPGIDELAKAAAVVEKIAYVRAAAVTALDEDGPGAESGNCDRGESPLFVAPDPDPGERPRFGEVRCDEVAERQKLSREDLDCGGRENDVGSVFAYGCAGQTGEV
jgi:hypothetical protein